MDRERLLRALPTAADFNDAPKWQQKETAENFIESILEAIADEYREPDDWEAHDIAAGLGFVMAGMYRAALAYADRALTPPGQRAPLAVKEHEPPTARQLRDALDYIRGMPARNG